MVDLTGIIEPEAFSEAGKVADSLIAFYLPTLAGNVQYLLRRAHDSTHFSIKPNTQVPTDLQGVLDLCERFADSVFRTLSNPHALYKVIKRDYQSRLPEVIKATFSSA